MSALPYPDNGILFMDNYNKIENPTNMKTPPPPMWGDPLEEDMYVNDEDFYNHEKAMKQLEVRNKDELAKLEANGGPRTTSQRAKVLKLKRKVVYTYEYSDDSDKEGDGEVKLKSRGVNNGPFKAIIMDVTKGKELPKEIKKEDTE